MFALPSPLKAHSPVGPIGAPSRTAYCLLSSILVHCSSGSNYSTDRFGRERQPAACSGCLTRCQAAQLWRRAAFNPAGGGGGGSVRVARWLTPASTRPAGGDWSVTPRGLAGDARRWPFPGGLSPPRISCDSRPQRTERTTRDRRQACYLGTVAHCCAHWLKRQRPEPPGIIILCTGDWCARCVRASRAFGWANTRGSKQAKHEAP